MQSATLGKEELTGSVVDLSAKIVILPIRHHSPACAYHVTETIRTERPTAVLIEGPIDGNPLIEFLVDPESKPPVAIYGFTRSPAGRSHAGWFPFCEHSPEWVALRTAKEINAHVAFIDIPTWERPKPTEENEADNGPSVVNGYADKGFRFADFVTALCQRTNLRDFDELWDHLFEVSGPDRETSLYWNDLATYCDMVRVSATADETNEFNDLREMHMASEIARHASAHSKILAIVGGFHRLGLLSHLDRGSAAPKISPRPTDKNYGCYLAPYSEEQLDSWSGYQAGMPAPAFYRRLWETERYTKPTDAKIRVPIELLGRLANFARGKGELVSTADLLAAEQQLRGLSKLRGHPRPARADLLDAVTSTWVKGNPRALRGVFSKRSSFSFEANELARFRHVPARPLWSTTSFVSSTFFVYLGDNQARGQTRKKFGSIFTDRKSIGKSPPFCTAASSLVWAMPSE